MTGRTWRDVRSAHCLIKACREDPLHWEVGQMLSKNDSVDRLSFWTELEMRPPEFGKIYRKFTIISEILRAPTTQDYQKTGFNFFSFLFRKILLGTKMNTFTIMIPLIILFYMINKFGLNS